MTNADHDHDDDYDDDADPGLGQEVEPASKPAVWGLVVMSAVFGLIGLATGFATVLGVTATAAGGDDTSGFGPMIVTAVSSLVLGLLLVAGAVLLWRAHRSSRVVISAAITLLTLSSLARMTLDSVTFISVIGTALSLLALVVMGYLLTSDDVRKHVDEGIPLRLR